MFWRNNYTFYGAQVLHFARKCTICLSMKVIRTLVKDYGWIHLGIGMLGNLCFFIGSVFFLWEGLKPAGVWLFIIGSGGMLIGSAGGWAVSVYKAREPDS